MLKREKEMVQFQLDTEKAIIKELEKEYQAALNQINEKIRILQSDELTQSRIYHLQYQKALQGQVQAILEKLHGDEYTTIQQYLHDSYTDAFVGTMYNLHGQNMPLIIPIDQKQAVKAILTDSQINEGLYEALGVDAQKLKKAISSEITRGIASALTYVEIARNISNASRAPLSRAKLIVRTEGHRIQQEALYDASEEAKAHKADVVNQWCAVLDFRTRNTHRRLDGQLREVGDYFEMDGKKAKYPGGFGDPAEDCNCRCTLLTRARAALDEEELKTLQERADFFGLDKSKDFADFKEKYLNAGEALNNQENSAIIDIDELTPCLRRMSDGKIVNTTVFDVSPTKEEFKDWEFDWTLPEKNGMTVRAIKADGDNRIQGMIALKADPANFAVYVDIAEAAPFNNPHNKLFVEKEFAGVGGHLFAEAVKQSYKHGYGGFVYFKAKTNLIEHYERELGAVLINPKERIMAIDERSARKLYERYYQEE